MVIWCVIYRGEILPEAPALENLNKIYISRISVSKSYFSSPSTYLTLQQQNQYRGTVKTFWERIFFLICFVVCVLTQSLVDNRIIFARSPWVCLLCSSRKVFFFVFFFTSQFAHSKGVEYKHALMCALSFVCSPYSVPYFFFLLLLLGRIKRVEIWTKFSREVLYILYHVYGFGV